MATGRHKSGPRPPPACEMLSMLQNFGRGFVRSRRSRYPLRSCCSAWCRKRGLAHAAFLKIKATFPVKAR